MKLPARKQKELSRKGKRRRPPMKGGAALARARQFQKQRGISEDTMETGELETDQKRKSTPRKDDC